MNKLLKNQDSRKIFILTSFLIIIGIIMIASATFPQDYFAAKKEMTFLTKQLIAILIGFVLLIFLQIIPLSFLRKYSFIFYLASIFITILTLTSLGKEVNYAHRWIEFKGFTIMPSDFMKIGMILFVSNLLSKLNPKIIGNFWIGIIIFGSILVIPVFIILKQPDLSTAMTIVITVFILFQIAGFTNKQFIFIAAVGMIGVILIIFLKSDGYSRTSRIAGFLDPLKYQLNEGWQITQSLSAISSGGLLGKGLGRSVQKYSYLSQAYNDYIFAIICEEFGFLGAFIVILLFMNLVITGINIGKKSKYRFNSFLAIAISLSIGISASFNMAVAVNLIPSTGLTLPFISYGGSSIMSYLIMIGLLIKISNENKE